MQAKEEDEPVPRIKITPQYDWTQDNNSLRVRVPILNSSIKNILVDVADFILKVNATDRKMVKTIDLWGEINPQGASVVYANNVLEVTLLKVDKVQWPQLLFDQDDKEVLIKRRQESYARKEQMEQNYHKNVKDLKLEFDQHATREQMRVEDIQRQKISEVKKIEKEKALNYVFDGLDDKIGFQTKQDQQEIKQIQPQQQQVANIQQIQPQQQQVANIQPPLANTSLDFLNKRIAQYEEIENQRPKPAIYQYDKEIFDPKEVDKKPLPEVRKVGAAVQLEFTERIHQNLAMREQHFKDAPLPRLNKKFNTTGNDNNPLFLKDLGDGFFKNNDYYSAINAYGSAYKANPQLIICLANRAACYLLLFNYTECISDSDTFIQAYQSTTDQKEKLNRTYLKVLLRKGVAYAWKGALQEAKTLFQQALIALNEQTDIAESFRLDFCSQVSSSSEKLELRITSMQSKRAGDQYFKSSSYQKAIEQYNRSIETDQNELAYGNLGLIYMKQGQPEESLFNTQKSIDLIQYFLKYSNSNPVMGKQSFQESHDFLFKLFMRKAKCLFLQQKLEDALQSIKQAISLDEMNKEARDMLNQIQKSKSKEESLSMKQEATSRLRKGLIGDALTMYNDLLKRFTPQEDLIDLLEVLLNKCVCCMNLGLFDDVLGACVRGIQLITQQKNRVLAFEKLNKGERQNLHDYHIRFLVRRSNAYLKQNQVYHASCDLQEALKLDPNNQQIKTDLDKLSKLI